jgi:hypothetical protein
MLIFLPMYIGLLTTRAVMTMKLTKKSKEVNAAEL